MPTPRAVLDLAKASHRTWGWRGLERRALYELSRRSGLLARAEQRWLAKLDRAEVGLGPHRPVIAPDIGTDGPHRQPAKLLLYGAVELDWGQAEQWHTHPLTGITKALAPWSTLPEGDPADGDIKDLWELGRLSWLGPLYRAAALRQDDSAAERCWRHLESFIAHNPPYQGPQWMCGQESALRGITVSAMASALMASPTSTPQRLASAAHLLAITVGRVRPSLGYALSQRNNHAVSEASFLWTSSLLLEALPDAEAIRAESSKALTAAATDQWYADGSYAQQSPTYQRLALHGLLWTLAVSRATGTPPPDGISEVVDRSVGFLSQLMQTETGAMPNLGGNDGALLFDLTPAPIGDFRPVLAHAAAVNGVPSGLGSGPWDEEARWFGLTPTPGRAALATAREAGHHHVHRGHSSHAVLRAGPLRHRPSHADQLHVDIWIDGTNVALDPGSYRYTAPAPWGNALADEAVHNVPRLPRHPQAIRRGRFFWIWWREARVVATLRSSKVDATLAELTLPGNLSLRRLLVRLGDLHVVVDRCSDPGALVRWNFPAEVQLKREPGATTIVGDTWHGRLSHSGTARVGQSDPSDPTSGWASPTYGVRRPCKAIEVRADELGIATARFAPHDQSLDRDINPTTLEATSGQELAHLLAPLAH